MKTASAVVSLRHMRLGQFVLKTTSMTRTQGRREDYKNTTGNAEDTPFDFSTSECYGEYKYCLAGCALAALAQCAQHCAVVVASLVPRCVPDVMLVLENTYTITTTTFFADHAR